MTKNEKINLALFGNENTTCDFMAATDASIGIERARDRGWSVKIRSYIHSTFDPGGYSWMVWEEGHESNTHYTSSKQEAEFEALAYIAEQILME